MLHLLVSSSELEKSPDVAKFYAGRSVFVTGGTGFVGKQILEKLLRSCPAIERIYILVRPKRKKTVQERLEEILTLLVGL